MKTKIDEAFRETKEMITEDIDFPYGRTFSRPSCRHPPLHACPACVLDIVFAIAGRFGRICRLYSRKTGEAFSMALTYRSPLDVPNAEVDRSGSSCLQAPLIELFFPLAKRERPQPDPPCLDFLEGEESDYDNRSRTSTSSCAVFHFAPMTLWAS